jgi:hypothetical protein
MPMYSYHCGCGHYGDYYQTIEGRDSAPDHCGQPVRRIITAPSMVIGDIAPYKSMCDGTMVMGRMQHRDHLKRHSVIEVGDQTHHLKPYGQYKSPPGLKETLIREVHKAKDAQRRR